jgi:hypothetical protein
MAMMFRGTFTTEFYATLHDALHLEVDLRNRGEDTAAHHPLHDLWLRVEELGKTGANPAG